MSHVDNSEASESDIKEELRRRLLRTIDVRHLADQIADLLIARGRKPGTPEKVAAYLATELISKFAQPNRDIEQLIENRPRQLSGMLQEMVSQELLALLKANPQILRAKRRRVKIATDEERQRRNKAAKNRYERLRRARHIERGLIEQEFGEPSPFSLGGLLDQSPPWGPCLDDIFHGGRVKMCYDIHSIQSLFGLDAGTSGSKVVVAPS